MQKKHRNRQKDILFVLISSFIVVVAWISFNIYHIWITSTIPSTITPQLDPITPIFDTEVRQQLKTREQIEPLYDKQTSSVTESKSPSQTTLLISPTPEATNPLSSTSSAGITAEKTQPKSLSGQ